MIRTAAGLALLFTSVALVAQTGASAGVAGFEVDGPKALEATGSQAHSIEGGTVVALTSQSGACPIDMHASQGIWDRTIRVHEGENERTLQPFGQRISLNLKDSHPARIVAGTVRVRGLNGKSRALPTPADTAQRWNAVRILKVTFDEENDGTVMADLRIGGFTSVGYIQLIDVTYSDGSKWTISGSNACRVQPDPMMLITER